jgi:hypothetical protein
LGPKLLRQSTELEKLEVYWTEKCYFGGTR